MTLNLPIRFLFIPLLFLIVSCDSDNNSSAQESPSPVDNAITMATCPCFTEESLSMDYQSLMEPPLVCTTFPSSFQATFQPPGQVGGPFFVGVTCNNAAFGTENCLCCAGENCTGIRMDSLSLEEYIACNLEMEKFATAFPSDLTNCLYPTHILPTPPGFVN